MGEDQDSLVCTRHGGFAEIRLNRPDRLNALSHALLVDLRALLADLEADETVRAIVLTGAGRAFSAGADLAGGPSDTEEVLRRYYNPLISEMVGMNTPMVAAVNGVAAGAGFALALACDLRIASAAAAFQLSFVKVGLVPDAGSTWLLPRAVGLTRAMEISLLGTRVSATQALTWSLVNEVVDAEDLDTRSHELATHLAGLSASVGPIRRLLLKGLDSDLPAQLEREALAQGAAQHHPHYAEARAAFREKREPRFR
jgi:2-(1,2-epoxy-1,2-dihydrophenyl)acetyl-CoA isomerase